MLAIITFLVSIDLLTLSGWLLASAAIIRTAGYWAERMISHETTTEWCSIYGLYTFRRILPLSLGEIVCFRQVELLNRLVWDVNTLDHLYLRVISPLA